MVTSTVVEAAGEHKWAVVFDYNGVMKIVTSKSLKLVEEGTGLPLDSSSDMVSFVFFYITNYNHSNAFLFYRFKY